MIVTRETEVVSPASKSRVILVLFEVLLLTLSIPLVRVGFLHLAPDSLLKTTILRIGVGVVVVALATFLFVVFSRKDFKTYGIGLSNWSNALKFGVLLSVISATAVVASMPAFTSVGAGHFTGYAAQGRMVAMGFALASLVLFVLSLRFYESLTKRIPIVLASVVLVGLWATPLLLVDYFDRPFRPALIIFVSTVIVAGIGEEFIFRGFIQSRLNAMLGRPFRIGGVQFGWGLFVASLLFGFVHIFNGVDFIAGRFNFQWVWGIGGFVQGMFLGYLREKTGSFLAGAILHGNANTWQLIVGNLR